MSGSHAVTELLKSLKSAYQEVIDDAVDFYKEYETVYGLYARQTNKVEEAESQLTTIEKYKEKNGVYPQIKGYDTAEIYIDELNKLKSKAEQDISRVEPTVFKGFERRREWLNSIAKKIAKATLTDRDASQFIGTMMLRTPMPEDVNRCPNNEKNKPIFIAAQMVCLLRKLVETDNITEPFICERLPSLVHDEHHPDILIFDEESVDKYVEQVLTPIIIAALIHQIGSYSIEAELIFAGNRYRPLDETERKKLIRNIYDHSLNYLRYGLGQPQRYQYQLEAEFDDALYGYELTETLISNYTNSKHPMGNLLRIPMIYSSFMLSTKPSHDYKLVFKAYDILQSGVTKEVVYPKFAGVFLDMVGQYPVGSGVFFISKDTRYPERAIVSRINPSQPTSAIVKQLTRRQVMFDDHTQVEVSEDYLINNEDARINSDFTPSYFKKQYPKGFFWNPIEAWERDINHNKFWRRDNSVKRN
jgi:hypothetical protein